MSPPTDGTPGPGAGGRAGALGAAVTAAFLWASYYGFVLGLGGRVGALALMVYPFLIGGLAYGLWAAHEGHGPEFLRQLARPDQWARGGVYVGIQSTVLVVTLQGSAVDAALLTLAGDVALTPLLVMIVFGEGRRNLGSPLFLGGLGLSAGGSALTILAGGRTAPLGGLALLAAVALPVCIAVYFVSVARAARTTPASALAGSASVLAGLFGLPFVLVLPASVGSLGVPSVAAGAILVAMGVTSFFVGPYLYFAAIQRVGIVLPALLMTGIPIFTLGIAAAVAGQYPSPLGLLGVPIAIAGALLAVAGTREPAELPSGGR